MHQKALDSIDLYCTVCRTFTGTEVVQHKLELRSDKTEGEFVLSGWLECPNCCKQYPIKDGVPLLFDDFVTDNRFTGQYLDAHYGGINGDYWREMNAAGGTGLTLDVGCSVGRFTFDLARSGFAVGLDVNIEHLKAAAMFQRRGTISFSRKTRSLRSENIEAGYVPSKNVLFILADIHNPPFRMETFDFAAALNLLDSVKHPLTALGQMDAGLKPGGRLLLSSPYIWQAGVSEEWLESADVDSHLFIKQLLTGNMVPEMGLNYRIVTDKTGILWRMRAQDTLLYLYNVDIIAAEKGGS